MKKILFVALLYGFAAYSDNATEKVYVEESYITDPLNVSKKTKQKKFIGYSAGYYELITMQSKVDNLEIDVISFNRGNCDVAQTKRTEAKEILQPLFDLKNKLIKDKKVLIKKQKTHESEVINKIENKYPSDISSEHPLWKAMRDEYDKAHKIYNEMNHSIRDHGAKIAAVKEKIKKTKAGFGILLPITLNFGEKYFVHLPSKCDEIIEMSIHSQYDINTYTW